MGIAPPSRGTNYDVTFIIDHLNSYKEDTYEDPEEGSTPLIDLYIDELEAYKKVRTFRMGNCPLKLWIERTHKLPPCPKSHEFTCVLQKQVLPLNEFSAWKGHLISNIHCCLSYKTAGTIVFTNQNL